MTLIKVAKTTDIPTGKMKGFDVDGCEILIANLEGNYYAVNNRCTHFQGKLSDGTLDGRVVTCPKHHASFDVITGKAQAIHGINLNTYSVKIEGPDILIES